LNIRLLLSGSYEFIRTDTFHSQTLSKICSAFLVFKIVCWLLREDLDSGLAEMFGGHWVSGRGLKVIVFGGAKIKRKKLLKKWIVIFLLLTGHTSSRLMPYEAVHICWSVRGSGHKGVHKLVIWQSLKHIVHWITFCLHHLDFFAKNLIEINWYRFLIFFEFVSSNLALSSIYGIPLNQSHTILKTVRFFVLCLCHDEAFFRLFWLG